ncbi:MAG: ComEC family competence protein, partial [Rickettsiales bacterium]|nr:ComEC family competence protein [Rickettsiales bacterium]
MRNLFNLIGFAIGIALYFALPFEPAIAMPICFAILFAANAFVFRRKSIVYSLLFITCFGFFYSTAYTRNFGTTQIAYPLRGAEITGRVDDIDWLPDKVRLFIGNYRLSLSDTTTLPNIGDTVAITATLFPPNGADLPGGFDMAQWSFFHNISATGFITKISIEKSAPENSINYLRNYLHNKLQSPLFDSLVLGYKHTLTAAEDNAWKAAGINHVFSISGFHITLVGGWLFAIFYF